MSITCTMTVTATAAEPAFRARAPATFVMVVTSAALTSTVWVAVCVVWLTRAPEPTKARVVRFMTSTMKEPVTAALPPPALPPTATEETAGRVSLPFSGSGTTGTIGSRVASARTSSDFAALTRVTSVSVVPESMKACVVTVRMLTATEPPTAVPPVESAPATARFCRPMNAVARTLMPSLDARVEPLPTEAVVVKASTWMPTEPATLAVDLPPAAASPHETTSLRLPAGVMASTVMPAALICAPPPTEAVLVTLCTLSPIAAPTAVSLSSPPARPIALPTAPTRVTALTTTVPIEMMTTLPAIEAVLVCRAQLTVTAAATATPPLLSPDWLLELLVALSVESLAFGSSPPVLPAAFGLFATESLLWSSPFLPLSLSPLALALATASLLAPVEATTLTALAVRLRRTSASVTVVRTLTATAAPTETLAPPASASEDRKDTTSVVALTVAAPMTAAAAPLPSSAVVLSCTMAMDTDGATPTLPEAPASSRVLTSWKVSATIDREAPPVRPAPSSTAARVTRTSTMFSASEAPTPTLPPFALAVAEATSWALLRASSDTAPVPAEMLAPAPTVAVVVFVTRLRASEPAMPTLSLPAPALARARTSCSARRWNAPVAGLTGSTSPEVIVGVCSCQAELASSQR